MTRAHRDWPKGLVSASTMANQLGVSEEQLLDETDRLGIPHDGSYRYDPELVRLWLDEEAQIWMGHS